MSSEHGDVVKVELTFSSGTVLTLTGAEAKQWVEALTGLSSFRFVHGVMFSEFEWVETKKKKSEVLF